MVNTREIAEEYRLSHWARIMQERTESGLSIKAYCKQIGICGNTYFYWQRRVRAAACEQLGLSIADKPILPVSGFSEVRLANVTPDLTVPEGNPTSELRIEVGGVRLSAGSAYPAEKLAEILQALTQSC